MNQLGLATFESQPNYENYCQHRAWVTGIYPLARLPTLLRRLLLVNPNILVSQTNFTSPRYTGQVHNWVEALDRPQVVDNHYYYDLLCPPNQRLSTTHGASLLPWSDFEMYFQDLLPSFYPEYDEETTPRAVYEAYPLIKSIYTTTVGLQIWSRNFHDNVLADVVVALSP